MGKVKQTVNVKVTETELFKAIIQLLKDITEDTRIDSSIRQEYLDKIKNLQA